MCGIYDPFQQQLGCAVGAILPSVATTCKSVLASCIPSPSRFASGQTYVDSRVYTDQYGGVGPRVPRSFPDPVHDGTGGRRLVPARTPLGALLALPSAPRRPGTLPGYGLCVILGLGAPQTPSVQAGGLDLHGLFGGVRTIRKPGNVDFLLHVLSCIRTPNRAIATRGVRRSYRWRSRCQRPREDSVPATSSTAAPRRTSDRIQAINEGWLVGVGAVSL